MNFLTKNAPPGAEILEATNRYFGQLIFAVLWSFGFLFRYSSARSNLYYITSHGRYLQSGAMMPEFGDLVGSAFRVVWIVLLLLVVCIALNY